MSIEPFHLERFFARHEFTAPHLLSVSDCETRTVGELLALEEGATEAFHALALGYTRSEGSPELREAIAARDPGLAPDDILVHAAGVEVLLTVALAVLEAGDHAIVQAPCYQAARSGPEIAGAGVTLWPGRPDAGWAPDLDALPGLLRPRTRLLAVNTPHNPTGYHFSREELGRLVDFAEAHGLILLVDEAYRGGEYRDEDRLPCAATLSPSVVSLGLVSKAWGLPGLRIAWLATRNPALREAVARVKDYTTICAPAPAEFLATLAVRHGDRLLGETRALLRENLALLDAFMERQRETFRWAPPGAGSVALARLVSRDAEEFCRRAREEAGVLVAPGPLFDGPPDAVRLGFGRRSFPKALSAFEAWLSSPGAGTR